MASLLQYRIVSINLLKPKAMKTIRFYNVLVAALAMTLTVSASFEAMAQSSTRKNTSGTAAQKAPSRDKVVAPASASGQRNTPSVRIRTAKLLLHRTATRLPTGRLLPTVMRM